MTDESDDDETKPEAESDAQPTQAGQSDEPASEASGEQQDAQQQAEAKGGEASASAGIMGSELSDDFLGSTDEALNPMARAMSQPASSTDLSPVYDIPVKVSVVLGRSKINVADLLRIGKGGVLNLDRKVGEAIDIYINERLVARGEVVVVDEKLGISMTEIVKQE